MPRPGAPGRVPEDDPRPSRDRRRQADRRQDVQPVSIDRRSGIERRHGERRSYQAGCDCTPCRAANADYAKSIKASPTGTTLAAPVCQRLQELRLLGLGYRRVAELADVAPALVLAIRMGKRTTVRTSTALRLLAVHPSPALGSRISSQLAARHLKALKIEAFSQAEVARRLGYRRPRFDLQPTITVRRAKRLERLYHEAVVEARER